MENLGGLAILLAFCVAIYATTASVVGRPTDLVSDGRGAASDAGTPCGTSNASDGALGFSATKPYYDNPIAGSRFLVLALR